MAKNEQLELFHLVVTHRELNVIFAALELLHENRDQPRGPFTHTEINRLEDQLSRWRSTVLNSFTVQLSPAEGSKKYP
jgi:hypothetical protein